MKKPMEVDNFFKERLETVEVKFNPAHWDKLQQSLQSPNFSVEKQPEIASKVWSGAKIIALIISTALIVLLLFYLLKKEGVKLKSELPIHPEIETQSLPQLPQNSERIENPQILQAPAKDTLILTKPTAKDSVEKKLQKQLKDSLEESNFIFW